MKEKRGGGRIAAAGVEQQQIRQQQANIITDEQQRVVAVVRFLGKSAGKWKIRKDEMYEQPELQQQQLISILSCALTATFWPVFSATATSEKFVQS